MLILHKIIPITHIILNSDENLNFDEHFSENAQISAWPPVYSKKKKKLRIFLCKSVPIFTLAHAINHVIPMNRELAIKSAMTIKLWK